MGQVELHQVLTAGILLALASLAGCKIDEDVLPTGPVGSDAVAGEGNLGANTSSSSPTAITPPIIADPLSGSTVADPQPSLTVLNSARQGGPPPTYLFQVSAEADFTSLEAQSDQIPEDPGGSTTWIVDRSLEPGEHFWRVRARSGTIDSDFSSTATFTIGTTGGGEDPPSPPPAPSAGTLVSDPLNGGSIGEVSGGQFTAGGWQVTSPRDFIRYEVPPISNGWVEFDTSGLRERNSSPDQFMLFGMWDPSAGNYRTNPFRVHLQKLHPDPHNPPYLRVRWIAGGEQHDEGSNFFMWDPNRTYRWRIEWGPSGSGNRARVFLDGELMIEVLYQRDYRPNVHWIELGIAERQESVVGVTYSNLRIGT